MIRVNCPVCWRNSEFPDALDGQIAHCRNCGIRIPVKASGQKTSFVEEVITSEPKSAPPQTPTASQAIKAGLKKQFNPVPTKLDCQLQWSLRWYCRNFVLMCLPPPTPHPCRTGPWRMQPQRSESV